MTARLSVRVDYGDIPGKPLLVEEEFPFDGTPEGFDRAVEAVRVAVHEKASVAVRPCGQPGPWHERSIA